jgi:non-ribosomal peptide synthetase component F
VVLLAAYHLLLQRLTGHDDILIGSPATTRARPEFASTVGYFVNSAVIRATTAGDPAFRDFLHAMRGKVLAALEHQNYPFPLLVRDLGQSGEAGRTPIFQALFSYLASAQGLDLSRFFTPDHPDGPLTVGGMTLEPFLHSQMEGQFELELELSEGSGLLTGRFKYDSDLFEEASVQRFQRVFQVIVDTIVRDPDRSLSWILTQVSGNELLTPEELVADVNREEVDL